MSKLSRLRSLWRNLVHRGRVDRDLDDEVRGMFDLLVDEKRGSGLTHEQARRAAMIQLGRPDALTERIRDVKAGAFLETWVQDVRYAVRLLRRGPLFATFAIASLALGIGATGAIFSLFDSIALRRLNVPEAGRLVVASWGEPGGRYNYSLPYPQFEAIRQRSTTLDSVSWHYPFGRVAVGVHDDAETADGVYVSGDYYRTLRLAPALGRLIDRADDRPGQTVAVLNHAYWQRRFGGRTDVIGTTISLNRIPFTVIGVEPSGFSGTEVGRPYDMSIPIQASPALNEGRPPLNGAFTTWLYVLARLKPGVTRAATRDCAAPGGRCRTLAHRPAVSHRIAAAGGLRRRAWRGNRGMGQPDPASHRHPGRRARPTRPRRRLAVDAFHVRRHRRDLSVLRATAGTSRHLITPVRRHSSGRRRTAAAPARSHTCCDAGRDLADPPGCSRPVPAHAREPLGAGSRLQPRQRADAFRRSSSGREKGGRRRADIPPSARRAAAGPGRALGHDVGRPSRQRRLVLRHVVPEYRRQDTDPGPARPGRVQPRRAGILRNAGYPPPRRP